MLPLYLLTSAKTKHVLIELKNGETLNGDLVNCDSWMNLTLKNVIQSSANGDNFLSLPEIYIRGIHIKYLRLPEEIMDHAKEQNILNMEQRNRNQKRRTGPGNTGGNSNRGRGNYGQNRNGGYNNNNTNNNNRRYNQSQSQSNQGNNAQGSRQVV